MDHGINGEGLGCVGLDIDAKIILSAFPQCRCRLPCCFPGRGNGCRVSEDADVWLFVSKDDAGKGIGDQPGGVD